MSKNVTQKLIAAHLAEGRMQTGEEIGLRVDQTLTQDATGTMVMLEFEAMGIERVRTELSAQYVDHNLLQTDYRNADDHLFLHSACRKFGVWYSRPEKRSIRRRGGKLLPGIQPGARGAGPSLSGTSRGAEQELRAKMYDRAFNGHARRPGPTILQSPL
jgi:hypothetical protein